MKPVYFLSAAALMVASCAPISEDECRGGDWGSIGLEDGKDGRPASILTKYAETCAEFGVAPDQATYLQARAAGLQFYCTPENAYKVGRSGDRLNTVCEPQIQQSIRPAYNKGRKYYEINEEMQALENRIDELQDDLRDIRGQQSTPELDTQALVIRNRISDIRHDIFVLDLQKDRFDSYP